MNNPVIRFGLLWLTLLYLPCLYANEVRNGDFSDATRFWFIREISVTEN